jgi:hypothetical protein
MKKLKLFVLGFLCAGVLSSCDPDLITYDGSSRVTATGKVVDASGAAVGGVRVTLKATESDDEDILNTVETRADGTFIANFPFPHEDASLVFTAIFEKNGYREKAIYRILRSDMEDLSLELNNVTFFQESETVEVLLNFAATANNRTLFNVTIEPDAPADYILANPLNAEDGFFYPPNYFTDPNRRVVLKNSNITCSMEVEVNNGGVRIIENVTQVINVGTTSGAINVLY